MLHNMALRKALAYSRKRVRPYTRNSRSKSKAYIKVVPGSKIAKFKFGSPQEYNQGKHPFHIKLITEGKVQVRDNALEAGRMLLNKELEENAPGQFFMEVKVYPHHLLRDNKTAAGAGADRLSSGMSHSFGSVIGRAAIVRAGETIFFVSCANEKAAKVARGAMGEIKSKIPGKSKIVFENILLTQAK